MRKLLVASLVVGMVWAVSGCGASKASTPKEAVKNFQKALETGDKALFLATVDYTPEQKPVLEDMFSAMSEAMAFHKAMEKQYGAGKGMSQGPAKDFTFDGVDVDANFKIEGDKAKFDPKGGNDLELVKKDGAWRVSPEKVPTGKDAEKAQKMFKAMVKALQDIKPKIGQKDYTAEKINAEVGAEIMKAMFSGMGEEK